MKIEASQDKSSIVLVGAFNPRIFHPSWLALNNVISREQAAEAKVTIIHEDITQFIAAYMSFDIQQKRFQVKCDTTIYRDMLKDLVLNVFRDHLPHSLAWFLGINRSVTFSCGSESARNKLGERLAPKAAWGAWGIELAKSSVSDIPTERSGMTRLTMMQRPRPDGLKGHIQADISPSPTDISSVLVDLNNHFVAGTPNETTGCAHAMELLANHWTSANTTSEFIIDSLVETVESLK